MQISRFTLPQELVHVIIKAQDIVGLFLWLQMDSASTACYTQSNCQPEVLPPGFWTSEGAGSSCDARFVPWQVDLAPWKHILTHITFCHGVFGKKSTVILLTHHTLILCDFFLSHTMMNPVKGPHFETKEEIHIATVASNNVQCTTQLFLEVLWQLERTLKSMYVLQEGITLRKTTAVQNKFNSADCEYNLVIWQISYS